MFIKLFLTFIQRTLVANPNKLLFYTVANPARGLLNRGKKKTALVYYGVLTDLQWWLRFKRGVCHAKETSLKYDPLLIRF